MSAKWKVPSWYVDPSGTLPPSRDVRLQGYAKADADLTMRMWEKYQREAERIERRERIIDAVILVVIITLSALYFWAVIRS